MNLTYFNYYVPQKLDQNNKLIPPKGDIFANDDFITEPPMCKCRTQDELRAAEEEAKKQRTEMVQNLNQAKGMPNFAKNIQAKVDQLKGLN